jgi:hypothetical protein
MPPLDQTNPLPADLSLVNFKEGTKKDYLRDRKWLLEASCALTFALITQE